MSRILPAAAFIAATLAMNAAAFASANVSCRIDDANLTFELEGIAGSSGPIMQVHAGNIALKSPAVKFSFGQSHIIQQWSYADDMRLQIEVSDEASKTNVNLVILARFDKKADKYNGRYILKISKAGAEKELKGRIKECVAG